MLLLLLLLFGVVAFNSVASLGVKTIGLHGLPNGNQHWALTDHSETELFSHNISDPNHVGVMTHFWMETGRGPQGRYICDNNIIRYYIDGERIASLQFTPSMAAGSAVGREPLSYYLQNQNATPRGSTACAAGQDGCGMDLIDGWPWQTAWTGKSGAEGNWVLHFQIPFARSVRITAQVASAAPNVDPAFSRPDIKPGTVASGYFMTSGLVGPEDSLQISLGYNGLLKLPTIGTGNLRLQMRRLDGFAPNLGDFVPYVQYEAPAGKTVSGAVLMNTIMLQGMHTVYDDVEMCFWALVAANSSFGGGGGGGNGDAGAADAGADDDNRPLLIGTGMEDYFANAFSLSNLGRNYYHDDAGLTHIRGGPLPRVGGDDMHKNFPTMFSAYRMFAKDPLLFSQKLEIVSRYIPPGGTKGKCNTRDGNITERASTRGRRGDESAVVETVISSYTWFYTWDEQ